jgi:uncharacterized membrane protein YbhN (UPF0104 family)
VEKMLYVRIPICKPIIDRYGLEYLDREQIDATRKVFLMIKLRTFARWFLKSEESNAKRARRLVKLAIVAGMLIAIFWLVPVRDVFQALLKTDPLLFAVGVILSLLTIFFTSVQMKPLLDNQGINRSILQINNTNLAVKFYLLVMPTSLVASGYRWYRFAQPEGKVTESFVALAFYRLFRTFLVLTMGLGFLLISVQQNFTFRLGWIVLLVLGIILIWYGITRYSIPIYNWFREHAGFILDQSFLQSFLRVFEKLLSSASTYADMPTPALLLSMSAGILAILVGIASGVFLAQAIGIDLSFVELGWVLSVMSLATQFTFSIMEGLGVREVTLVALLSLFEISAEQAVVFSFLIFSRGVIISLLGGLIEALDALRNNRRPVPDTMPQKSKEI